MEAEKDKRSDGFNRVIDATGTFLKEIFPHACKFVEMIKNKFSVPQKDNKK